MTPTTTELFPKCPDYFFYDGETYQCVGNDDNQFWAEANGESKGFEQNNCTPLYLHPSLPAGHFTSQDIIQTFDAGYSNGNIDTGLSGHEYLLNKYGSKSTPTHRLWIEKSVEVDGLPEVSGAYYATIESKHGHVRSDSCSYDALEDKWDLYHIPGYPDYFVTHYLVPLDTNI